MDRGISNMYSHIIQELRTIFAHFGNPETIVSDSFSTLPSCIKWANVRFRWLRRVQRRWHWEAWVIVLLRHLWLTVLHISPPQAEHQLNFCLEGGQVKTEPAQCKQKEQHDARAHDRFLVMSESMFVHNYQPGDHWLPGVIQRKTGSVSFLIKQLDGRECRCHQDQVRKRTVSLDMHGSWCGIGYLCARLTSNTSCYCWSCD